MKKILFLVFFIFFFYSVFSQTWFPQGATWYFNKQELMDFAAHGYSEYSVVKDTLVHDTIAKVVKIKPVHYGGNVSAYDTIIVHESNSKVYYFKNNSFKLMYDFNLNVNDTLKIDIDNSFGYCDSIKPIIVDSIKLLQVNGIELKVQYVSYKLYSLSQTGNIEEVHDKIIEKIGREQCFIYAPSCVPSEGFAYMGLRCYEDENILYKSYFWNTHFQGLACNELIDRSLIDVNQNKAIAEIYPNPFENIINISLNNNNSDNYKIIISNILGTKLKEYSKNLDSAIDLSDLKAGIYFLTLYNYKNNSSQTYKLMKK